LPEGVWTASFAGLAAAEPAGIAAPADPAEQLEPVFETLARLSAEAGRTSGFGDAAAAATAAADGAAPKGAPPAAGDGRGEPRSEAGCWRTQKTKVLLAARRAHCGCETYRSWRCACGVGCRVRKLYGGFCPLWKSGSASARGCGFDLMECCLGKTGTVSCVRALEVV
jgi:hypothetical protein